MRLTVETAEAREVHHIACLIGYGANAVNPYLALASVRELAAQGKLSDGRTPAEAETNYQKSIQAGLLKVMARMGISTLASYRGAQVFEAISIGNKITDGNGDLPGVGGVDYRFFGIDAVLRYKTTAKATLKIGAHYVDVARLPGAPGANIWYSVGITASL